MECHSLRHVLLICAVTLSLSACREDGGAEGNVTTQLPTSSGDSGKSGIAAILSIVTESPGLNCASGGSRIDRGIDSNRNGVLDAAEIASSQYVCNSASANNSLVETRDEPAGTHCPSGGKQFVAGLDGNGNGRLDPSEINSSGYICNGEQGSTGAAALTAIVAEAAGANCSSGGVRISSGTDANRNGLLDGAEITGTQYICNGISASNALIRTDNEPAGLNCTHGGTRISAGLDTNDDAELDASEITASAYACNGAPGAAGPGVSWQDVAGTSVQAVGNRGYLANNDTAEVVVTLPAAPVFGELVQVSGIGKAGWRIAQNADQFVVTRHLKGEIAAAWTTRESSRAWQSVASSADGLMLVAGDYGGKLHISIDGGVNWTQRESDRAWRAVASSADGQRLLAAVDDGQLYVSTDAGVNWTAYADDRDWSAVASSANGQRLLAAEFDGQLYTSGNGGLNWTARNANRKWAAVASSADGQRLVAVVSDGQIYVSNNAGFSWSARESSRNWTSVAASADGQRMLAAAFPGQLYTSSDAGVTWTARESSRGWYAVASSANGQRLLAAEIGGQLYSSSDFGVTWKVREWQRNWSAVASSADGTRLIAAVVPGQLHTSVPMPRETSTAGVAGSVTGRQYDAITLQYTGAGRFVVLNFVGELIVQ